MHVPLKRDVMKVLKAQNSVNEKLVGVDIFIETTVELNLLGQELSKNQQN